MHRHWFCAFGAILLIALLLSMPTVAAGAKKSGKKRVTYEKETLMTFDDEVVEGRVVKPDGFFLLRKRPKKWEDLLFIRKDFRDELKNMQYDF